MTCNTDELMAAKLGYPVFANEDSDEVVGFISGIQLSACALEFCLFNPVEVIDDTIEVLDELLDHDYVIDLLMDLIEGDIELVGIWADADVDDSDPEMVH